MGKVAYITVNAPFGAKEAFVMTEMLAVKQTGINLLIIPRDRPEKIFHEEAKALLGSTIGRPLFDSKIFFQMLIFIMLNPISFIELIHDIACETGNLIKALKNLMVLPKGLYLAAFLKKEDISHIHAHWASTTSTMTYIVARILNIPWSFTAHRWDIAEDNLLKNKCRAASFVRVISERGREEIIAIIKESCLNHKIHVVHMGVPVPADFNMSFSATENCTILCPANLVDVKGHRYLIEACKILSDKQMNFKCIIAGDGPLEKKLMEMVQNLQLRDRIKFVGRLSHENICNLYRNRQIAMVILPSIVTDQGEQEGIPVALMEAMSYGVPVIATNTGGIPELIGDGSGILVDEKNPDAIAAAIDKLIRDKDYFITIGSRGREKVFRDFNISVISRRLTTLFSE